MSSEPSEFARQVLHGFERAGLASDVEVGNAGGPSSTTMTKLRKVRDGDMDMPMPRNDTLRRIDRAAGWHAGAARALWLHGALPAVSLTKRAVVADLSPDEPARLPQLTFDNLDGYVRSLEERITQLEERLDVLEADPRLDPYADDPIGPEETHRDRDDVWVDDPHETPALGESWAARKSDRPPGLKKVYDEIDAAGEESQAGDEREDGSHA